jgi:hypothetical protein
MLLHFEQTVELGSHAVLDKQVLDGRAANLDAFEFEPFREPYTAPGRMRQT